MLEGVFLYFSPLFSNGREWWGLPRDQYPTYLCSFLRGLLKYHSLQSLYFDMFTTHNDHPSDVQHVLPSFCVLFPLIGHWVRWVGGLRKGLVHNMLVQVFTLGSSKFQVSETIFLIF